MDLPQDYLVFCAGEPVFPDGKSYLVIDRSQPYTVPDLPFPFIAWTKIGPSNEAQLYLIPDETLPVSENAYLYPLVEGVEWGMNFLFCSANGGTFSSAKGNHLGKLYPGDRYFKEHWSVDEYDRDIIPIMSQLSSHIKRDNHRLIGWNTRADGSGTQYQIGEAVPCAGLRTVLYAQWEKATSSGSLVQTDLKWSLYADRTLILDGKAPANSTIFSACYDSDERLLSIAEIGIGEPLSLSDSAKVCTLFVLNQDSIPLCPSRDIVLS